MQEGFGNGIDYHQIVEVPQRGILAPKLMENYIPERLSDRLTQVLIPSYCIDVRTRALGKSIARHYKGVDVLTVLTVLRGAAPFAEDLKQSIFLADGPEMRHEYIKISTYGDAVKNEGETRRDVDIQGMREDIQGRHLLVVEDIVDQGFTLNALRRHLEWQGAGSVTLCTLLDKQLLNPSPEVQKARAELNIKYIGFRIPDIWVAGYGLDVNQEFRELPFIATVNERFYRTSL